MKGTYEERTAQALERLRAYPDAALARISLADQAAELAERAAELVGAAADGDPLEMLDVAHGLRSEAARLAEAAVVAARTAGASWTEIGAMLDVTRQAAADRYKGAEDRFREGLVAPVAHEPFTVSNLARGLYDPAATAARIDRWLSEARASSGDEAPGSFADHLPVADRTTRQDDYMRRTGVIGRYIGSEGFRPEHAEDWRIRRVEAGLETEDGKPILLGREGASS
ncbi:hypothetical protein [Glycomyces sp. MUSA5-2]|uniref:hypothetical protein n=1 Tax=Glycomyces sp. MUSA5-2 TaxID=2053002 RepID=UPI00300824FB